MAHESQESLTKQLELLNRIETVRDMQRVLHEVKTTFVLATGTAYDDYEQRTAAGQPNPQIVDSFRRMNPTSIIIIGSDRLNLTLHAQTATDKGVSFSRFCLTDGEFSALSHGFIPEYEDISLVKLSQEYYSEQPVDLKSQDIDVLRSQIRNLIFLTHDLNRAHQKSMSSQLPDAEPI